MINLLTNQKLKTKTFSLGISIVIAAISFLPYIHDFDYFDGKEGFSGFSSLRVAIWIISLFIVAISGWVFAFINAKGKDYRFVILAPVSMLFVQLIIYVLDARQYTINDFNIKVIINFLVLLIIILMFFKLKK